MTVKSRSMLCLPMPITATRPPKHAASRQFCSVEGRPTHSTVTSKPSPPVISFTALGSASGPSFSTAPSRPKRSAYESFFGATSQIHTRAPRDLAAMAASTPIVPAPTTSTRSPSFTPARWMP